MNKHIKFYNSISFKLTVIVFLSFALTNLISSGILNRVERPRVEGFMAVSYTHLDVYKRQGVEYTCEE